MKGTTRANFVFGLTACFAQAGFAQTIIAQRNAAASQFVGMWRLVALNGERPSTGAANAATDRPTGAIIYDSTGHMAVQIQYKQNRPRFVQGPNAGTAEEKSASFDAYTAYWGTYTVDAKAGTVTHHIEGALNPNNVGKDNLRYYEIQGNRLTLNNPDDGKGGFRDRRDTSRQLVWERVDRSSRFR